MDNVQDLLDGLQLIDEKFPEYDKARQYFDGSIEEVMFATDELTRRLAEAARRYRVNIAKIVVTTVSDRLEVAAVTVPGEKDEDEAITEVLQRDVWDANSMTLETPDWNRLACMYGDLYLTVWADDDGDNVRIWANRPENFVLVYDEENPLKKRFALRTWITGEGTQFQRKRVTLYYADRIERWVSVQTDGGADPKDWQPYEQPGQPWPLKNPYGEVPVFHLRTQSQYGVPEHKDAYGPQDILTKYVVNGLSNADGAAFPVRVMLLEPGARINGNFSKSPGWDDETEATADMQGQRIGQFPNAPGQILTPEGVKSVAQFDPADPDHFLKPAGFAIRLCAQVTQTPMHYFDPSGDVPSGESLRTADAPLVKKVEFRQQRFGQAYAEALTFALLILGIKAKKVDVRWESAAHSDDKAAWEKALLQLQAGVPSAQVLMEMSYTRAMIDAWNATTAEQDLSQLITNTAKLAQAARDGATAASLGGVSGEVITTLFDSLATRLAEGTQEQEQMAA